MDFQQNLNDKTKPKETRLFNITPNPIDKSYNPLYNLITPGKTPTGKMTLMTPNFDINEKSNLDSVLANEKFQI